MPKILGEVSLNEIIPSPIGKGSSAVVTLFERRRKKK
jgi:hypothetical protein